MVAANILTEGWTAVSAVLTSGGGGSISTTKPRRRVGRDEKSGGRSWWGRGLWLTCILLEGGAPTAFAAPSSSGECVDWFVKKCAETAACEGWTPCGQGVSASYSSAEGKLCVTTFVEEIQLAAVEGRTYHWQVAASSGVEDESTIGLINDASPSWACEGGSYLMRPRNGTNQAADQES